ncbi:hypothetical protein HAX54_035740 [Datura stramonium]|uniref:Uncharacterized protein n=1 Tax=Datura stramonium TaxID=4076 RepID=A0ABS8SFX6_DATST|nr:hypothetical protein [Datura stramonium]
MFADPDHESLSLSSTNEPGSLEIREELTVTIETTEAENQQDVQGLQFNQTSVGTSIHQQKYIKELIVRFDVENFKTDNTHMTITNILDLDEPDPHVKVS